MADRAVRKPGDPHVDVTDPLRPDALGADEKTIGALMKGEPVYIRVDAFNENGITEGEVFAL